MTNEQLATQIAELKTVVTDSSRALRGYNGEIGVVARVASLEKLLEKIMTNDIPHLRQDILHELEVYKECTEVKSERNVTWPSLLFNFMLPVALGVLIAVVTAYVLRNLGL